MAPLKSIPLLNREAKVAEVRGKRLTWTNPNWHMFIDKGEVYIHFIKDFNATRKQYQVFRGIWSSSQYLADILVPVDITGYLIPEGHRYSGAPVGAFIRTDLTITNKLPLLRSSQMLRGKIVCVEDLILGGETPLAVVSHNNEMVSYRETVDASLLRPIDCEEYGYNPCTSFDEIEELLVGQVRNNKQLASALGKIESVPTETKFCSCSMQLLMQSGCKCSGK